MNVQYFFPMCVARGCCGSQIKLNIYFKIVEYILRNKVEELVFQESLEKLLLSDLRIYNKLL